jgi:hypothetical protein
MPRKSAKRVGALVKLGRRRTPGLGLIIKVSETPTRQLSSDEKQDLFDPPLDWEALNSYEKVALVKWITRPSDYTMLSVFKETAWYPLSWLKVVSKATH